MKKIFTSSRFYYFLFLFFFTLICLRGFRKNISDKSFTKNQPDPKFRFNSYRIYEHVPGFHEGDGKKDWITIDKQGFRRSEDVAKTKPQKTFRVFLLEAALQRMEFLLQHHILWFIYTKDETIDAYLEKKLKSASS